MILLLSPGKAGGICSKNHDKDILHMLIPSKTNIYSVFCFCFFSAEKRRLLPSAGLPPLIPALVVYRQSKVCLCSVSPWSLLPRTELIQQQCQICPDWQAVALQASVESPLKLFMTSWLGTLGISRVVANHQPSKWATSDTTTGWLVSEEGALVISLVASKEGPSWGMVAAGWPREATINRKSLVRRGPVAAAPLMALVATLEELFMLEPRWGASQHSRARKHL